MVPGGLLQDVGAEGSGGAGEAPQASRSVGWACESRTRLGMSFLNARAGNGL